MKLFSISLLPNWKRVLRKAWSIKLILLSSILGGLQVALSIVGVDWVGWRPEALVALLVLVNVGAVVARLLDQNGDVE